MRTGRGWRRARSGCAHSWRFMVQEGDSRTMIVSSQHRAEHTNVAGQ